MLWILDDGPLDALAVEVDGAALAGRRPPDDRWLIADATEQSAQASPRRRDLLTRSGAFEVFSVHMGSLAAEILYTHLTGDGPNAAPITHAAPGVCSPQKK